MNDAPLTPHSHANEDVGVPEWYSRGYLPHQDRTYLQQSITFRLADSLPQSELKQLEKKLQLLPRNPERRRKAQKHRAMAGRGHGVLRSAKSRSRRLCPTVTAPLRR